MHIYTHIYIYIHIYIHITHTELRPEMRWLVADMTDTSPVFPQGKKKFFLQG